MNQQAMLRKMQQLKREMEKAQEEIVNTEFKTSCGPVTVIMMGDRELKQVIFEEGFEANTPDDLEMLSDMIVAATHQACEEIDRFTNEKMGKYGSMLGGFGGF